jgi:hypothetical protein
MIKHAGRDGLEVFVDFIHNKYGEVLDLDITTLILLFSCGKHWSVYLLRVNVTFTFIHMFTTGLHSNLKICVHLAKL